MISCAAFTCCTVSPLLNDSLFDCVLITWWWQAGGIWIILGQIYCGDFLSFKCPARDAGDFPSHFHLAILAGQCRDTRPLLLKPLFAMKAHTYDIQGTKIAHDQTDWNISIFYYYYITYSGWIAWWQAPSSARCFCFIWNGTIIHGLGRGTHHAACHMDNRLFGQFKILAPTCEIQIESQGQVITGPRKAQQSFAALPTIKFFKWFNASGHWSGIF